MANSTTNIDVLIQSQASKEVTANAYFDAAYPATLYGRRASTSASLVWGYYGGNVTKSDGTLVQIANGTVTLTTATTNYIVAQKTDGVVSTSTATTNWNNTADYWRLYSVIAGTSTVSSYTDYREIGKMTGAGSGSGSTSIFPVTKTISFTLGSNENQVICNGTATITVTLPAASSWKGRVIYFKNIAAFGVISASSNIVPINSTTAGTAILPAVIGRWAVLVSDGTNWVTMSQGAEDYEFSAPTTKTTAFTITTENDLICNGTATMAATLPAAATYPGRSIRFKNRAAFTVTSASSNVKPIDSDTAGTAILPAVIGSWTVLTSDGTNWIIMSQGLSDNYFTTPVIKTTAFTITTENELICNGTATMAATLPVAASYPGRSMRFKNLAAFTVTSASSNVKPIDSDIAGTAILPAVIGSWVTLISDGTNWIIMSQGLSDNYFTTPVSKTTDFTVGSTDNFIKCNGTATITVTLPAAATYPGRRIVLKTIAAFTVISASSNVLPIDSDTAGTSILAGTAGKWAELVSDGTNWVIMMSN